MVLVILVDHFISKIAQYNVRGTNERSEEKRISEKGMVLPVKSEEELEKSGCFSSCFKKGEVEQKEEKSLVNDEVSVACEWWRKKAKETYSDQEIEEFERWYSLTNKREL